MASARELAIDVVEYPADQRDEVMQRIGGLITDVACETGSTPEMALEFARVVNDYVAEIEASGGGTVGTA